MVPSHFAMYVISYIVRIHVLRVASVYAACILAGGNHELASPTNAAIGRNVLAMEHILCACPGAFNKRH